MVRWGNWMFCVEGWHGWDARIHSEWTCPSTFIDYYRHHMYMYCSVSSLVMALRLCSSGYCVLLRPGLESMALQTRPATFVLALRAWSSAYAVTFHARRFRDARARGQASSACCDRECMTQPLPPIRGRACEPRKTLNPPLT